MDRVKFIQHNSKQILFQDLRDSRNSEDNINIFKATKDIIVKHKENTILLLTDVTNAHYDKEAADYLKSFSKDVTPYIKKSAAVGVTGIKRILLATLLKITRREIKLFDLLEDAKDYLSDEE